MALQREVLLGGPYDRNRVGIEVGATEWICYWPSGDPSGERLVYTRQILETTDNLVIGFVLSTLSEDTKWMKLIQDGRITSK